MYISIYVIIHILFAPQKKGYAYPHFSAHAQSLNWITCLDFWLTFPFGLPLTWSDSIGFFPDSPEPLLFTYAITALFLFTLILPLTSFLRMIWFLHSFRCNPCYTQVGYSYTILNELPFTTSLYSERYTQIKWASVSYKDSSEPTDPPEYS